MPFDFRDYLAYAKKYLSLAEEAAGRREDSRWLLIPSIVLAWAAIESFVNNRCDDLSSVPQEKFDLHERAFLLERRLRFSDRGAQIGQFVFEGKEYQTLENKIFFLLSKMGARKATGLKGGDLWRRFRKFKDTRDSLLHPKRGKPADLRPQTVRKHVQTAGQLIQEISKRIWKKSVDL